MKPHAITALVAIAGAAVAVSAQNTVTYSFSFNGGGNFIAVIPGEAVSVVVTANLSSYNPTTGPWCAADGGFSITGNASAGFGTGSWSNHTIPFPYNFGYGYPWGTTAGTPSGNTVSGAIFGTGPWFGFSQNPPPNPDDVWSGAFTVPASAAIGSSLALSFTGFETTNVWTIGPPLPGGQAWPSVGTTGTINVIPAPAAGFGLLGLGGLAALRQRR